MLVDINDRVKLLFNEGGFTFCNCVYVDDEVKAIIDTGADEKSLLSVKPENIDMVLYTHHHYDHIRGNYFFQKSKTFIHELDFPALVSVEAIEHYNSLDEWEKLMPGYDRNESALMIGVASNNYQMLSHFDTTFVDEQVFDMGRTKVQVMHTPGHSIGHSAFWFPDDDFIFLGDICLTKAGPWYGEIYASPDDMEKSIDKIIELKPARMASCHINKIITDDGGKRLQEFKNRITKRDERIYHFLQKQPASIHDIAASHLIYRQHPTPFVLFWEKLMVGKHLERLKRAGMVEGTDEGLYYVR